MRHGLSISSFIRIIGIALLAYILWRLDLREIVALLFAAHPVYFFLGLILSLLASFTGLLKWEAVIRAQQTRLPLRLLTGYYFIGMFLGMVTPGKLGEFWRARYLARASSMQTSRAVSTVFIDRGVDLAVVCAVGSAAAAHIFLFPSGEALWWSMGALFFLSAFVYLLGKFWSTDFVQRGVMFFWKSAFFLLRRQQESLSDSAAQAKDIIQSSFSARVWVYGILYYVLTVLAYYMFALSLSLTASFFYLFLIVALVNLVLILPITIFGLGTRDASYIFLLGIIGIAAPEAVAFSTLLLIGGMIVAIPGGILLLKNYE